MFDVLSKISHSRLATLMVIVIEMLFFATCIGSGCVDEGPSIYCLQDPQSCGLEGDGGVGGLDQNSEGLPVIDVPFPEGFVSQCTQGPGGSHSHEFASTAFGVDLDTSNNTGQGVYAPVSGIAHVHGSPGSQSGFGYHINLFVGSGRYVVLAHLEEIVVQTGDEVVAGQFLGIEGCSGSCTGDHVHIGLSEGNPAESAEDGVSVPFALRARDVTGNVTDTFSVSDLTCALSGGHHYESRLEVATWHPDGMLLSVPGESDIYVVDQGRLHEFRDEHVMFSYGFWYEDVVPMSPRERDCWQMGSSITGETCYRAVKEGQGFWLAYECEDNPGRYRLPIPGNAITAILGSWGIDDVIDEETELGSILLAYPQGMGMARLRDGALVREVSSSTVYAINEGVALPILDWEVLVSMNLEDQDIFLLPGGALEDAVLGVGSCPSNNCIDWDRIRQCGGAVDVSDVVDDGGAGGPNDDPPRPDDDDLPDGPSDDDDDFDQDCQIDTDGDGVVDCEDNCPLHDNGDQHDIDGDSLGDSCDLDVDGDGVPNSSDCDMFNASVGFCPESACDDGADNDMDGDFDCNDSDCTDELPCQEEGDDDDDTSDDDDATEDELEGDDDDATEGPELEGDDDDVTEELMSTLEIVYTPPGLLAPYTYIELSGEYTLADGSVSLWWTSGLATVVNANELVFTLSGVETGDTFRFSLEFYDALTSYLSWGCIGSEPYTAQGTLDVSVDGVPVFVSLIDNFLGGCEDLIVIP